MIRAVWILFVTALLGVSTPAFGWGYQGHEYVGSIADQLLNPNARKQVETLLGFSLQTAGPWLDCVKSVKPDGAGGFAYAPDPSHPEYRIPCTAFEQGAEKARMEEYVKRNWTTCPELPGGGCHGNYHFADVAIQHDDYERRYFGTNDHDIVSAINAALAILKDKPAPQPFSIRDKKEALFLLAHLMGDLHQPLHVGAVYLDTSGTAVNPDGVGGHVAGTDTRGGNSLLLDHGNLHAEWDAIPNGLGPTADRAAALKARKYLRWRGDPGTWAAIWASDTVQQARNAFAGLSFVAKVDSHWGVRVANPDTYRKAEDALKREQLLKAGGHLAALLNAVWP
ncbi:S1/P1 nuclease [Prosthecomicrobium hirschii]|uniref:S1/P1 nuclease n=1 Tax=Prosthecodimorpha hirschii TaxID=665126 RepID=UPI00221FCB86|nr:S1/P1 nuclease [Prosthecomicrobium hirschii]MCW1842291.1 S1/P1 nuclease [Prosthecomicrobium hirschii]